MRFTLALGFAVVALSGCDACIHGEHAIPGDHVVFVKYTREPFALAFGDAPGAPGTTSGDDGCAPLTLALRGPDDVNEWHKPEAPKGDEVWLHSGNVENVSFDGADLASLLIRVAMLDDTGTERTHAGVRLRPADDGYVDVDVVFAVEEVDVAYVGTCFTLVDGEHLVGGGERFDGPDLRGHIVPLYFDAPGEFTSGTNESHAPVPFFASNQGYSVLVDEERVGAFDVGVSQPGKTALRFQGNALSLAVRTGTIVDNVSALARRMGLPPEPPSWALAPMQWRNGIDADVDGDGHVTLDGTAKLLADANEMRARHIPTSTIWIDAPWETGYNTFRFNENQLPHAEDALHALEQQGFHVITWATDNVDSSDDSGQAFGMPANATQDLFNDFAGRHFLVAQKDGTAFTFPWGRGNGGFVDFTDGAACSAYQGLMQPLLASGVRGFKLDYGETMRPDLLGLAANDIAHFHDGTTAAVEHTRFARLYHECYLHALDAQWPNDHFVITRTGGIYDQKNGTAIWPGDLDSGFQAHGVVDVNGEKSVGGLPSAVGGYLSLAMSAYPLYGSDVGGYRGDRASPENFLRWAQLGSASTVMQVGGGANQAAWDADYVADIDAFTVAARFHMDLLPMWQEWLKRASQHGTPVAVPVGALGSALGTPVDEDAWSDAFTFVLGGADEAHGTFLVAPVIEEGAVTRSLFVPQGSWTSWWDDGVTITGPGVVTVAAPRDRLPVFVNDDAIAVLSDPRIDTALDNGPDLGGVDDMGARRVVRTKAAPGSAQGVVGDVVVARLTSGSHTTITAFADDARPLVVDLRTPGKIAREVDVDNVRATGSVAVADESALFDCAVDATCVLVTEGRVLVAKTGRQLTVDVDADLP